MSLELAEVEMVVEAMEIKQLLMASLFDVIAA